MVTTELIGDDGKVVGLRCERDGETMDLPADLVLIAAGFTGPHPDGVLAGAGVSPGGLAGYGTSRPNIFLCGDMRRGQSLVVWAIREGRECAAAVDQYLRSPEG